MLYKAVPFEVKVDKTGRSFEGYASTWTKDLGGDIIVPGAFDKTIAERLDKRMIKVRWLHYDPMGIVSKAHTDSKGLYVIGDVPDTATNQERLELMSYGVVDKLSIGYDTVKGKVEYRDDGRNLLELKWYEVSPVDIPMNEDTAITTVKGLENFLKGGFLPVAHEGGEIWALSAKDRATLMKAMLIVSDESPKAGRVLSAKNRSLVEDALAALQSVLAADDSGNKSGTVKPGTSTSQPSTPVLMDPEKFQSIVDDMKGLVDSLRV